MENFNVWINLKLKVLNWINLCAGWFTQEFLSCNLFKELLKGF